jgi:tryptophan-rich sensory protein
MAFSVPAFLCAIGCCLISLIVAGKSGNNDDKEWFANLIHPDNSFLLKIMSIVGLIFYLLFGFVLYHLLVSNDIIPIILVILIIQLMGLSPFFMYKTKNLKSLFFVMLALPILVFVLIFFLIQTNLTLAIPAMVYLLWLVYDMSYFYRLMKLDKDGRRSNG